MSIENDGMLVALPKVPAANPVASRATVRFAFSPAAPVTAIPEPAVILPTK